MVVVVTVCLSNNKQLEKSLREMQAEVEEIKQAADKRLAEAREMTAGIEEKALLAEGKVHAAEALRAEANRRQAEADRKLQEVEAREGALRRERQAFNQECVPFFSSLPPSFLHCTATSMKHQL